MLTVIIPASNEAGEIGACLDRLLDSTWTAGEPPQIVVVANGCHDATADEARALSRRFVARGWRLDVLELAEGGKIGALNAGDASALHGGRVYLDADVRLSPALLDGLRRALSSDAPSYASGRPILTARTLFSRLYARFWARLPFMAEGVPGCGLFAVNAAGRARWQTFPHLISDDGYVRALFMPEERIAVAATYDWPVVEGFARLVRVRRRQDRGMAELRRLFPEMIARAGRTSPGKARLARLALADPAGFAAYSLVALAVRLRRGEAGWTRGR